MKLFTRQQLNHIVFFWIIYFSYYLARYDMNVAKVGLSGELHLDKESLGLILSLFTFAYAIGQVVHGYFADRIPGRKILMYGILGSALVNLLIYSSTAYWMIALLWMLNGIFQSTGWSITSKAVGKSLKRPNRAIGLGIWGTCYQVGGATAIILAGLIMEKYGWRYSFLAPSILLLIPLFLIWSNKNMASANPAPSADSGKKTSTMLLSVLRNRNMIFIMLAYMFLGYTRYSFINWGIEYQNESLKLNLVNSFINLSILPLGGVAGVILVGFVSDKFLKSRRALSAFLILAVLAVFVSYFMFLDTRSNFVVILLLGIIGALIAAGDNLIGTTTAMEFSKSDEEGHSIGVVDAFMYIGAIGAGYIDGFVIQNYGWLATKYLWIAAAITGALVLLPLIKREKQEKYAENSALREAPSKAW